MTEALIFIGLVIAFLLFYMVWKLRGQDWREYFSTEDGKGILKGIVLAVLACAVIAIMSLVFPANANAGTWFNDASVFAGIDYTKKLSPMCRRNSTDDRGTSNLGLRLNIWESDSSRVRVNTKYTHHSCVLGVDDRSYDAVGVEVEYRLWERRR
jgi:hypothetical protein